MKTDENLTGLRDVEKRLGKEQTKAFVAAGVLRPTKKAKKGYQHFDSNDVELLADLRDQELTLAQAVGMAKLAEFRARRAERLVSQVMDMLGVNIPTISTEPGELQALYTRAEDDLKRDADFELSELREWTKIFFAIGEEHLEALQRYVGTPEPHMVFLQLSKKLRRQYIPAKNVLSDVAAEYLTASSRCLRQTVYFFMQPQQGTVAARATTDIQNTDINRELLNLMFTQF